MSLIIVVALLVLLVTWIHRTGELRGKRVCVLIYHRIVPRSKPLRREDEEERGCIVFDDEFVDHLRSLREAGFKSISPEEYLEFHRGSRSLPDRAVMITFDDGWRSVWEYALPALRDAGMTATVFINTESNNANFRAGAPVDGPMTLDMWRELAEAGITIGSHGVTHTFLTQCDDAALDDELGASKRQLEAAIGRPVTTLAAPGGQSNARVVRAALRHGYTTFFAGGSGTIGRDSDPAALTRLGVERDLSGRQLVQNLRPVAILQHRFVRVLKQIPTRLLGPTTANRLRHRLIAIGLGWLISVRFLKRALAVGALLVAVLFLWLLVR